MMRKTSVRFSTGGAGFAENFIQIFRMQPRGLRLATYIQQLDRATARDASDRGRFEQALRGPFVVEVSRGLNVFVDFETFVQEQERADGKDALFGAYVDQINAFARGVRTPTETICAFGSRAEDVRALARRVYDECREEITSSRARARLIDMFRRASPNPVLEVENSITQSPFPRSASTPRRSSRPLDPSGFIQIKKRH
jgi:hypothetical protein